MLNEKIDLGKYDYSHATKKELLSVINDKKFVFQLGIYQNSNNAYLRFWGYNTGYLSYSFRNPSRPWDLTFFNFKLDTIGDNDYDYIAPASEVFGFDDNMSEKVRIEKWRELYNDSLNWKLLCEYDDFCEESFSKSDMCSRLRYEIKNNNLQRIYIIDKCSWSNIYDFVKNIMTSFLNENKDFVSESRGLKY